MSELKDSEQTHIVRQLEILEEELMSAKQPATEASFRFPRTLFGLPHSVKLFANFALILASLCYLSLLASIWFDTQMSIALITEGYGDMDPIELVQHTLRYSLWFFSIFVIMGGLFMTTRFKEGVKRVVAITVPLLVISDLGAAWLVKFGPLFAWQLWISGFCLALSFLVLFVLIQYDLWVRPKRTENAAS